jgi:hypothetical protein
MTSASPASDLVAKAARARLRPLGLRRRGRSRLWLDDHGWWLGLVEFHSPTWSQGSGLHVGAMWLWQDVAHFTFNISEQPTATRNYQNDEQFSRVAENLALSAQTQVQKLRARFPDLQSAADFLAAQPISPGWFWDSWNTGVAAALVGNTPLARRHLTSLLDEDPIAPWMEAAQQTTRDLLSIVGDKTAIRAWARDSITSCRNKLRLPPASLPF